MNLRWNPVSLLLTPLLVVGCDDPKPAPTKAAPSAAPAATSAAPVASTAAPATPPAPKHDCPEGTAGDGSFDKPCEAKGTARMMEVTWTGKTDDKGPKFRVESKSKETIGYGHVVAYFYDKTGKQLDTADGKKRKTCASANLFLGPLKPDEKALVQFSCLKKDGVPEGTDAIEAEIDVVGFPDKADEKKVDLYWRNKDLAPNERPKGGAKPAK